jgi:hypothetical protein
MGAGAMYGKALYTVHDIDNTKTSNGDYGQYIYKFRVNLYGYISFDDDVTIQIYGKNIPPSEQAKLVGAPKDVVEVLKNAEDNAGTPFPYSSPKAHHASKYIKGLVKGLIFTGKTDGRVVVVYDVSTVTPVAWKKVTDESWTPVDKEKIKRSLKKNLAGDFTKSKYEQPVQDDIILLKKISRLPSHMRVANKSLYLQSAGLESLPDNLTVEGDLTLGYNPIARLPSGLTVKGTLTFEYTNITELPSDLEVNNLTIQGDLIRALPPGLKVGALTLKDSAITQLPDDLVIKDSLKIKNTSIAELPQQLADSLYFLELDGVRGLTLPRSMNVATTFRVVNVTNEGDLTLPDTLISRNVSLSGRGITTLPTNIDAENIQINHTSITALPPNLHVQGKLDVGSNPQLKELPPGLVVGRQLSVYATGITQIPDDAQIRGEIIGLKRQASIESTF